MVDDEVFVDAGEMMWQLTAVKKGDIAETLRESFCGGVDEDGFEHGYTDYLAGHIVIFEGAGYQTVTLYKLTKLSANNSMP